MKFARCRIRIKEGKGTFPPCMNWLGQLSLSSNPEFPRSNLYNSAILYIQVTLELFFGNLVDNHMHIYVQKPEVL